MSLSRRQFVVGAAAITAGTALTTRHPAFCAEDDRSVEIGNEPQLLVDDWVIERLDGLSRTLHQPKKYGLIKEADGRDWDRGDVYHGNIVCRDNAGTFHMTYRHLWWDPALSSSPAGGDRAHWFHETTAYATSDDGIHWHKPSLGLINAPTGFDKQAEFPFETPIGMSKDNNLGCPIDFIYDLHANGNILEPDKRFLLRVAYKDGDNPFARLVESEVYYAADWPDFAGDPQWLDKLTPIPGATLSPRGFKTLCGYDHAAQEWFVVGQDTIGNWLKRGGRDIARLHSPDLIHWEGPQLVLPVAEDESRKVDDWTEYMYLNAYRIGGAKSGAWLGQLEIFDSDRTNRQYEVPENPDVWRKGLTELRLVISRDAGRSWQRVGGKQVWLPHHEEDNGYDRLVFGSPPTPVDDELRFYYGAWDGEHLTFNKDGSTWYKDRMRIGRTALATLRRDGYVSLDAGDSAGTLLTRPLQFTGRQLTVNLSAPHGTLRAELQDASGHAIAGFSTADCIPVTSDGVELPLRWRGDADVRSVAGRPVRVRFDVQNGSLYAFRFV